jgi:hypothetical protein
MQQFFQQTEFAVLLHFIDVEIDACHGFGTGADGHAERVIYVGANQVGNGFFDGGGEKSAGFEESASESG